MNRSLVVACLSTTLLGCIGGTAGIVVSAPNPAEVNAWLGTWSCASGKLRYTETFTPALSGKAMHVSVTGPYSSEGIATYDSSRKTWFYAAVNGDGSYAAMSGPVSGPAIDFKQVFPAGFSSEDIRYSSSSKYSSVYSYMANKKKNTMTEVCVKR